MYFADDPQDQKYGILKQCQNYNNKSCNILKKVLYSEDLQCYNNSIQIRAAARAEGGCKKER